MRLYTIWKIVCIWGVSSVPNATKWCCDLSLHFAISRTVVQLQCRTDHNLISLPLTASLCDAGHRKRMHATSLVLYIVCSFPFIFAVTTLRVTIGVQNGLRNVISPLRPPHYLRFKKGEIFSLRFNKPNIVVQLCLISNVYPDEIRMRGLKIFLSFFQLVIILL